MVDYGLRVYSYCSAWFTGLYLCRNLCWNTWLIGPYLKYLVDRSVSMQNYVLKYLVGRSVSVQTSVLQCMVDRSACRQTCWIYPPSQGHNDAQLFFFFFFSTGKGGEIRNLQSSAKTGFWRKRKSDESKECEYIHTIHLWPCWLCRNTHISVIDRCRNLRITPPDGGGGVFLACEDYGESSDELFPSCTFFFIF